MRLTAHAGFGGRLHGLAVQPTLHMLRHGAMGASVTVPQYAKVRPMSQPMPGHTSDRVRSAGAGNGAPGHGPRSEAARRGNPGKTGCRT